MTAFLAHHGIAAVFVLMAVDAIFPAASELQMLYGGALASGAIAGGVDVFGTHTTGAGAYVAIAVSGTFGYLAGAVAGWAIGRYGGRPFLTRHGRLVHLSTAQLERAERWFQRFEGWAVFVGRVTPVARSFISIPAGVFEVRLPRYVVLTTGGSAIWCFAWSAAGWGLGASWKGVDHGWSYVDYGVAAVIVAGAVWLILRRRRSFTITRRAPDSPR